MRLTLPDDQGRFGVYGGCYVPETLMFALEELRETFRAVQSDEAFQSEYATLLREFVGRPTPITCAGRLSSKWGGADIYLKREDLCHTGSHKLNNALGQALLAKRIGKKRIIAETGAGQHGVATATACALLGLECVVYMGEEDVHRQALNVFRMGLLGAKVVPVHSGTRTLKDAINEAMRDWVTNVRQTHYIVGSVVGPHPFPLIVREFQKVIGAETRQQFLNLKGKLPDCVMACVGGGSNAAGMFYEFISDENVAIYGVEAGGLGLETGRHAAALGAGKPGVLHGAATYVMQNEDGQIVGTHSISAGLDYPAVGPEHSYWKDSGRVTYLSATDEEALQGFCELSEAEGIIPALEPAHVIPRAKELAAKLGKGKSILICLSGRGDKDVDSVREALSRR